MHCCLWGHSHLNCTSSPNSFRNQKNVFCGQFTPNSFGNLSPVWTGLFSVMQWNSTGDALNGKMLEGRCYFFPKPAHCVIPACTYCIPGMKCKACDRFFLNVGLFFLFSVPWFFPLSCQIPFYPKTNDPKKIIVTSFGVVGIAVSLCPTIVRIPQGTTPVVVQWQCLPSLLCTTPAEDSMLAHQ